MKIYTIENTKEMFFLLEATKGVKQDPKWHPEEDVFQHSLQVLKCALRESNDIDVVLAALLHDVGKAIENKGHAEISCELLKDLAAEKTLFLIRNHRRIWDYLDGSMHKLEKCLFLAEHPWLPELIQLARFDRKGRNPNVKIKYDKENIIEKLNRKCKEHFYIPEHLKGEINYDKDVPGLREKKMNKIFIITDPLFDQVYEKAYTTWGKALNKANELNKEECRKDNGAFCYQVDALEIEE